MTMNGSVLLRILGVVCFALWIVLVLIKSAGGAFEEILPVAGLLFWLLSTLVP